MKKLFLFLTISLGVFGGTYDGTVTGTLTYPSGKFGNALTGFSNGVNYAKSAASLATVTTSSSWTFEQWFKGTSAADYKMVGGSSSIWQGAGAAGKAICSVNSSGAWNPAVILTGTTTITDGVWHHLTCQVSNGNDFSLFVDGVKEAYINSSAQLGASMCSGCGGSGGASGNVIPGSPASSVWQFGNFEGVPSFQCDCQIDEFAWWDVAKYSANFTPPTTAYIGTESNLRALFHFNGDVVDSAGSTPALSSGTLTNTSNTTTSQGFSIPAPTGGTSPYTLVFKRAPYSGSCGTYATITTTTGVTTATTSFTSSGLTSGTSYCHLVETTDSAAGFVTSNVITLSTVGSTLYTRVDTTTPRSGAAVMFLIPNSNSAVPYNSSNPTNLVVYVHGSGEDQTAWITDTLKHTTRDALLNAGYILIGVAAGSSNWGNQASVDAYQDAYKALINAGYNIAPKTNLYCQSMGGLDCAQIVAQNKVPNVISAACIYCVFSLSNMWGGGSGSYASYINTAYSITGTGTATFANMTYGWDPLVNAQTKPGNYGIAWRFYASAGDTVVTKAGNTDPFEAAIHGSSSESVIVVASGNHGDPSHFIPSEVVTFYARALARTKYGCLVTTVN